MKLTVCKPVLVRGIWRTEILVYLHGEQFIVGETCPLAPDPESIAALRRAAPGLVARFLRGDL